LLTITRLEITDERLNLSDIDAASTRLQRAVEGSQLATSSLQLFLGGSQGFNIASEPQHPNRSISSVYNALLEYWISTLPEQMHHRIRQTKERLARRIATEVSLSCVQIGRRQPDETNGAAFDGTTDMTHENAAMDVPSSQPSSQVLPTPDPTPTVASSTAYASASTIGSEPMGGISTYLRIEKPPAYVPDSVIQIISRWRLGSDPITYSWEITQEELEEADTEDELSQAKKDKLRRRADRLLRKQRRGAELVHEAESHSSFSRPGFRSSPPRAVDMGHSQVYAPGQAQSSQINSSLPMVQSQVEPGKHGGRPLKKKPKRVGGF
jgi:RNA polymerase I-specific transcription initiation factor RRN6